MNMFPLNAYGTKNTVQNADRRSSGQTDFLICSGREVKELSIIKNIARRITIHCLANEVVNTKEWLEKAKYKEIQDVDTALENSLMMGIAMKNIGIIENCIKVLDTYEYHGNIALQKGCIIRNTNASVEK